MKKLLVVPLALFVVTQAQASAYFGKALCDYPQYECIKVGKGQNWQNMFPDPEKREIVQKINRSYNAIWYGKEIVVPKNLQAINLMDVSPFPIKIKSIGEKQIIVDQDKLAWVAYDADGQQVNWGPISSGRDKCVDSAGSCRTLTGIFRFFSKENEKCRSNTFDSAPMPFCMFFHKGFALHGSNDIPGYRASHGCVRMFTQDAKWLNHNFVETSKESNHHLGTKVTVRPILVVESKKP
jgi:hypothetical protein